MAASSTRAQALSIAEDAMAYMAPRGNEAFLDRGDVVLFHTQGSTAWWHGRACRIRMSAEMADPSISEVRAWFRGQGRGSFAWMLGPSSTPPDLRERLLDSGAVLDETEPGGATCLVLVREPPHPPAGIEVREVATLADYIAYREIDNLAFDVPPDLAAGLLARAEDDWRSAAGDRSVRTFLALQAGRPLAFGHLGLLREGPPLLVGGGTLPEARGRGLYRALVHERWQVAQAEGHHALIVQAGAKSEPILRRLGFEGGPHVDVLVDRPPGTNPGYRRVSSMT